MLARWLVASGPLLAVVVYCLACIQAPSWSPNGKSIAYTIPGGELGPDTIWITQTVRGSHQLVLEGGQEHFGAPQYSQNGKYLAFFRRAKRDAAPFELCVIRTDGSDLRILGDFPCREGGEDDYFFWPSPSWSPDEKWIAVSVPGDGDPDTPEVVIAGVDEKSIRTLTKSAHWPKWSPDGKWIACLAHEIEKTEQGQKETDSIRFFDAETLESHRTIPIELDSGGDNELVDPFVWTRDSEAVFIRRQTDTISGQQVPENAFATVGPDSPPRFYAFEVSSPNAEPDLLTQIVQLPACREFGYTESSKQFEFASLQQLVEPISWSVSPKGRRAAVWFKAPSQNEIFAGGLWITDFRTGKENLFPVQYEGELPLISDLIRSLHNLNAQGRLQEAEKLATLIKQALLQPIPAVGGFPVKDSMRIQQAFLGIALERDTPSLLFFGKESAIRQEMRRWISRDLEIGKVTIEAGEHWIDGDVQSCFAILRTVPGGDVLIERLWDELRKSADSWKKYKPDMDAYELKLLIIDSKEAWIGSRSGQSFLKKAVQSYLDKEPESPEAEEYRQLLKDLEEHGDLARALRFMEKVWIEETTP